jgi:hypothetical protein
MIVIIRGPINARQLVRLLLRSLYIDGDDGTIRAPFAIA